MILWAAKYPAERW